MIFKYLGSSPMQVEGQTVRKDGEIEIKGTNFRHPLFIAKKTRKVETKTMRFKNTEAKK